MCTFYYDKTLAIHPNLLSIDLDHQFLYTFGLEDGAGFGKYQKYLYLVVSLNFCYEPYFFVF